MLSSLINTSTSLKHFPMLEKLCCPGSAIRKDPGDQPRMPRALPPQLQELPEQQGSDTSIDTAWPSPAAGFTGRSQCQLPAPADHGNAIPATAIPFPPQPSPRSSSSCSVRNCCSHSQPDVLARAAHREAGTCYHL